MQVLDLSGGLPGDKHRRFQHARVHFSLQHSVWWRHYVVSGWTRRARLERQSSHICAKPFHSGAGSSDLLPPRRTVEHHKLGFILDIWNVGDNQCPLRELSGAGRRYFAIGGAKTWPCSLLAPAVRKVRRLAGA